MANSPEEMRGVFRDIIDDPFIEPEFLCESPLFTEALEVSDALRECRWTTSQEAEEVAKAVYEALDARAAQLKIMGQGVTISSPTLTLPSHIKKPDIHELVVTPHDPTRDSSLDETYKLGAHGAFCGFYAEVVEQSGSDGYSLQLYYQVDLMQPVVSKVGVVKQVAAADVDLSTRLDFDQDRRRQEQQTTMSILKGITDRDTRIQFGFLQEVLRGRPPHTREQLMVLSGCTSQLMRYFARLENSTHYEGALEHVVRQRFRMWLKDKTHFISHKRNTLQEVGDTDQAPSSTNLADVGPVVVRDIEFRRATVVDERGVIVPLHLEPYFRIGAEGKNYRLPLSAVVSMTEAQSGNNQ